MLVMLPPTEVVLPCLNRTVKRLWLKKLAK
jgi:hypothetical protein